MTTENNNPEEIIPVDQNQKTDANPAMQTLFRFVSLRNPKLTEEKNNLGFVTRKEELSGFFDPYIKSWSEENPRTGTKFQRLELAAADFESQAFRNEKDVQKLSLEYYDLGRSLQKSEDSGFSGSIPEIDSKDLVKLWDNLIYQVVSQKDFYVKEAIIQTLKAIYYAEIYNRSGSKSADQTKDAKVVLPAKLFVDTASVEDEEVVQRNTFTVGKSEIGSQDLIGVQDGKVVSRQEIKETNGSLSVAAESRLRVNAEKSMRSNEAMLIKSALQTLKKELEKMQKSYAKSYQKSYNSEYEHYRSHVQPIIDSNNQLIVALENTFDENTTEAAKKAAYDQLELAEVPGFEFSFKNEVNFTDLQSKLNAESFKLFSGIFTEYDAEAIAGKINGRNNNQELDLQLVSDTELSFEGESMILSDDFKTYADAISKVDDMIAEQSKVILSSAEVVQRQYMNLGGVLVPVAKTTAEAPFSYFLNAPDYKAVSFLTINYLGFSFFVENDSWSVAKIKITAEESSTGNNLQETHLQIPVVDNKITVPVTFSNKFDGLENLKIEIFFDNGREALLEFPTVITNLQYPGIFELKSNGINNAGIGMAPKKFGVRRLGIADYLKVEQSVHAYVPGEVSNIENVMASELRHKSVSETQRSETITDTIKSQEVEKLSDTTKTDRSEMQTEVAKEIDRQQSWEAHASFGKSGTWHFEVGGSYANSTAQHDSTRQAVAKSQEITERALERVVTKISEERIQKIFKEVTLQNVHEFDNRGKAASPGSPLPAVPQHITGVYRWVDKKMKNQIYNYGKRLMFEFMIPEPARLHRLATQAGGVNLKSPIDPRSQEAGNWQMKDYNVDESFLEHWAKEYGVSLTDTLPKTITHHIDNRPYYLNSSDATQFQTLDIPQNYAVKSARVYFQYEWGKMKMSNFKGGFFYYPDIVWDTRSFDFQVDGLNIEGKYLYEFQGTWVNNFNVSFNLMCEPSDTYLTTWRQENFNAIIAAYTAAKEKFDADVKAAKEAAAAAAADKKEKLTNFYREIESNLLKQNCIAYLLQDYLNTLGTGFDLNNTLETFALKLDDNLDAYASLAKFMEQAFEWTVMDYTFYPYYWANRSHWQEMYLTEETDPLFRNFLQAGMARVIVTVKPGFEDAVQFFMTTGKIWNGGEVPVIGDPMYLSIVDELREPQGKPQGNYWITRVPTTLTILQDKSTGLPVTQPLPIFPITDPKEIANCENPAELEFETSFRLDNANMQSGKDSTSTLG